MTIRIPLESQRVDGIECHLPVVTLRVLSQFGDYAEISFVVDTGADMTGMSVRQARREHIPFDRTRAGTAGGLAGRVARYRGILRVLLAGVTHTWPCNFLETPEEADSLAMPVLGRAGFLRDYEVCTNDQFVTLRRRTPLRRWLSAVLDYLRHPFTTIRQPAEPL